MFQSVCQTSSITFDAYQHVPTVEIFQCDQCSFVECDLKLRKQAATEVRDLKAELIQKRNQSCEATTSLGLEPNLWDKQQIQQRP